MDGKQLTPAQKVVCDFTDKNIDLLTTHLREYCEKYKTQFIPFDYLNAAAERVKTGFREGVKGANVKEKDFVATTTNEEQ